MTRDYNRSSMYGDDWDARSKIFKELAGWRCEHLYRNGSRCSVTNGLQSHHLTYDRLRKESIADIKVLCRLHHKKAHGITD